MRLNLVLMILVFPGLCQALDLKSSVSKETNSLSISGETSQFKLEDGSLSGTGIRADFLHALNRKLSVEIFLSSAFSNDKSISSSFTGYGGTFYYNLFSECCEESRTVTMDGTPLLYENQNRGRQLQIGLGLNQYLLNGSQGVYSASGLGIGANYVFGIRSWNVKISGRFADMVSGDNKVQATFLGIGLLFPL
ncbi:MAG TPA: hypothetical protein PL182_06495 [Pseudobdellovibrionaceae bacterium]|nr:hypothetical protein [Pseudobdellovibrionaceae bacterium]